MASLVEVGFRVVSTAGTAPLVGAVVTVGLSGFVMFTLRHSAGLPLAVSALVVPFVVGGGFLLALTMRLLFDFGLLTSAGLMAIPLVGLALLFEWRFGDPR